MLLWFLLEMLFIFGPHQSIWITTKIIFHFPGTMLTWTSSFPAHDLLVFWNEKFVCSMELFMLTHWLAVIFFSFLGASYEDQLQQKLKRVNKTQIIPEPETLYGYAKWLTFGLSLSLYLSPLSPLPCLWPSVIERHQVGLVLGSSCGSHLLGMKLDNFQHSWALLSQICSGQGILCSN